MTQTALLCTRFSETLGRDADTDAEDELPTVHAHTAAAVDERGCAAHRVANQQMRRLVIRTARDRYADARITAHDVAAIRVGWQPQLVVATAKPDAVSVGRGVRAVSRPNPVTGQRVIVARQPDAVAAKARHFHSPKRHIARESNARAGRGTACGNLDTWRTRRTAAVNHNCCRRRHGW
jgi:hypothetical protein